MIKRAAAMCVHCGVPTRGGPSGAIGGKSKTTAVLLAVFLGIWTWLYTYRRDSAKFWITMAVTIANIILSALTLGLWLLVAWPVGIGFWIWSIVDVAVKNEDWYASYNEW